MNALIRKAVGRAVAGLVVTAVGGAGIVPISAAAAEHAGPPGAARVNCKSLEKCYRYGEMSDFLDVATGLVRDFIEARYGRPYLATVRFVARGDTGNEACGDGSGDPSNYTDMSYAYCPGDNTIYIGQDQLWQFYSQMGDAAAVFGLAHEYGHLLQHIHGVPDPSSPQQSIPHENQADCVAGAWFGYADEIGMVERPDDLKDLAAVLKSIASSEDDKDRDHGTVEERTGAVNHGVTGGLDACNSTYPETPIHTGREAAKWQAVMDMLRNSDTGMVKLASQPSSSVGRQDWAQVVVGAQAGRRSWSPVSGNEVIRASGSFAVDHFGAGPVRGGRLAHWILWPGPTAPSSRGRHVVSVAPSAPRTVSHSPIGSVAGCSRACALVLVPVGPVYGGGSDACDFLEERGIGAITANRVAWNSPKPRNQRCTAPAVSPAQSNSAMTHPCPSHERLGRHEGPPMSPKGGPTEGLMSGAQHQPHCFTAHAVGATSRSPRRCHLPIEVAPIVDDLGDLTVCHHAFW
jgi:hypothetical protein